MKFRTAIPCILLFIFGCTENPTKSSSLIKYIPTNASIIVRINDFQSLKSGLKNNDFIGALKKTTGLRPLAKKLSVLDYIKIDEESIIGFANEDNGATAYVLVAKDSILDFELEKIKDKKIEDISYGASNYKKYTFNEGVFYSTVINGKVAFSSSESLLNDIAENNNERKTPAALKRLYEISISGKSASVFINTKIGNPISTSILKKEQKENLKGFADWVLLETDLGQDHIGLNGLSIVTDSTKNYLDLFHTTKPIAHKIPKILPVDTDATFLYSFEDSRPFFKNRKKYLDIEESKDSIFSTISEIGDISIEGERAIVLVTYASDEILAFLNTMKKTGLTYQGSEIISLSDNDFISDLLNPLVKGFKANYFTLIGNDIVFTEKTGTLQNLIKDYTSGAAIASAPFYATAKNSLAQESSLSYISNFDGLSTLLDRSFLLEMGNNDIKEYTFAAQITADKDFYHTNIIIKKTETKAENNTISKIFKIQLDSDIATLPQFVVNHRTNKKEIVVQDSENNLYLIATDGKVLWKKQLKGTIQGKVAQVDIYKNGRLQLAFCTDNQFLVIDRNGETVQPFELSFKGGNVNPLAVFDYEGNKDYRFVVTQGEKIFMYNNRAKTVTGFRYNKAKSSILDAPHHFRIAKKDYLVFKLDDGSLKILNRTGESRVNVKEKIDFSSNKAYLYKNNFMVTDKKGTLYAIDTKGKIKTTSLNLNKDHGIDATSKTLAVMNENILYIKGKKIQMDLGVYSKPRIFYINDKIYVNVTDIQNQKIYLFDSQGKMFRNFPVFGNSVIDLADMDNDKKIELVAKDQDNSLIVYRIN